MAESPIYKHLFHCLQLATSVEYAEVEQWLNNNPDIDLNAFRNEDGWTLLLRKESGGIMDAIQALAETLQISNREAIDLIMREEANLPEVEEYLSGRER